MMDTKVWQSLRNKCPARVYRYGKYKCRAKSARQFEPEVCKYQMECPFVYWLEAFDLKTSRIK
jgi:hypothetical protein